VHGEGGEVGAREFAEGAALGDGGDVGGAEGGVGAGEGCVVGAAVVVEGGMVGFVRGVAKHNS